MGEVEPEGPFRLWVRLQLASAGIATSGEVTPAELWALWQDAYSAGVVPQRPALGPLASWAGYLAALWVSAGQDRAGFVEATGFGEGLVARWEAGIAVPSPGELRKIARVYRMPVGELWSAEAAIGKVVEAAQARALAVWVAPGCRCEAGG